MKAISLSLLCACILCSYVSNSATCTDITSYKKADNEQNIIFMINSDFSQGSYGWNLGHGYRIDPSGGMNGGAALFYERTDRNAYTLSNSKSFKVKAGKKYEFGAWVKGESLESGNQPFSCVALELYRNGNYLTGEYPSTRQGKDWAYAGGTFTADSDCEGMLTLYMQKGIKGKLWFDDVQVQCCSSDVWMIHKIYPGISALYSDRGKCVFKIRKFGAKVQGISVYAELSKDAKIISVSEGIPDEDGGVPLDFGKNLPSGGATIFVKVLDTDKKLIVAEKEFSVRITEPLKPVPGACVIDQKGRALVDGKPFVPIGFFMDGFMTRDDVKRLSGTPFNCLMPYWSVDLRFKDTGKNGIETVREVLDELAENNIKVIFSIKDMYDGFPNAGRVWRLYGCSSTDDSVKFLVNQFKNHPALLAWYTCDEFGSNWIGMLEKRRYFVNSLDPWHPTWTVYYKYQSLSLFFSTSDVIGVDPYPIERPGSHNMALVKKCMDATKKVSGNAAIWAVPQFFNMGNYNKPADTDREYRLKNFADPTEEEMRSMCLLMAIEGAKGFMAYSYSDLFCRGGEADSARRWSEVCRVGKVLQELVPFIVSEKDGPAVKIECKEGEVLAKAFEDDNGRIKVLIAGIGPGKSEAFITLPQNALKSRFGGTTSSEPGRYMFRGNDICSDILE